MATGALMQEVSLCSSAHVHKGWRRAEAGLATPDQRAVCCLCVL